ncbi:DMT family transporter [Streptomyces sp. NBC_00454]|uniref:DMT family transporter n=1 Tax=Streptomyces sp. NBC_00454 TaxID=2975747 RepID=UPI0030E10CE8
MTAKNSATLPKAIAVRTPATGSPATSGPATDAAPRSRFGGGTVLASAGVVTFSLTFPGTAWGLQSFGPWSLFGLRCLLAGLVAAGCLLAGRVALPDRAHWLGLAVVAGGTVIGFPLLTTLALQTSTTSHAAVVVGLLPLTTAVISSLRTGARPSRRFWVAAAAGATVVLGFTVSQSGGSLSAGDGLLFAALLVCAAGYTEGGRLARLMPGWQVAAWALVLCLPIGIAGSALGLAYEPAHLTWHGLVGLVWVAVGSAFLGLYLWYRGMAEIGAARASQLQLAQPLLTLVWSVVLLGEQLSPASPVAACAVLVCIAVTQRAK